MEMKNKSKLSSLIVIFSPILILSLILVSCNTSLDTKSKIKYNLTSKNDTIDLKNDIKNITVESNALNLKISYEEIDSISYETNYKNINLQSNTKENNLILSIKTKASLKIDEYFKLKIPKKYKDDFLINIDALNLEGILENNSNKIISSSSNININCKDNSDLNIDCESGNITLSFDNFNKGNNYINLDNGIVEIFYKNVPDSNFEISLQSGSINSNFLDVETLETENIKISSLNGTGNTKINLSSGIIDINKN